MSELDTTVPARRGVMQRLFDRIMLIAAGRNALWVLAIVSFTEASFFPIPPDPVLAAIVLARRERWLLAALVCTVASVVGGLFGYAIGAGLYEAIGRPVIEFYHLEEAFRNFEQRFNEWGAWIIVAKGFTPIPFKLVTIASGVVHMDLATFTISAALTRAARFLIVAGLFWAFGAQARGMIDRHFSKVMIGGLALIVLGFIAVIYI